MTINPLKSESHFKLAIILTDKDKKIQWVNDDFTQITGYALNEVLGKKPSLLQGENTEPEVVNKIRENINKNLPVKANITNYRKNGEQYLCKLVIYPILDTNEKISNFIAFEVDGTEVRDDSNVSVLQLQAKYFSSSLTSANALDIYTRLIRLFEEEKVYLNPNLRLKQLSELLSTNTRYLSQVINKYTNNNVLHLINSYRIEVVLQKITDEENSHLTIYGIAQQCGFKNKSTFYKVFKEFKGKTPKEYINEINQPNLNGKKHSLDSYPTDSYTHIVDTKLKVQK